MVTHTCTHIRTPAQTCTRLHARAHTTEVASGEVLGRIYVLTSLHTRRLHCIQPWSLGMLVTAAILLTDQYREKR